MARKPASASTRKGTAELRRQAAKAERERTDMLKDLMSSTAGRDFVWWLLGVSNPYSNPAVVAQENSERAGEDYSWTQTLDPVQATFYNLGKQHVGRMLQVELQRPELIDLFRLMQDEASAKGTQDA